MASSTRKWTFGGTSVGWTGERSVPVMLASGKMLAAFTLVISFSILEDEEEEEEEEEEERQNADAPISIGQIPEPVPISSIFFGSRRGAKCNLLSLICFQI